LTLRRLKEEIAELEEMNTQLNDEIKELTAMSKQAQTIEGGKFLPIVIEVCILLARNVGIRHVSPIIKVVVEDLAGIKIVRLPSFATLANLTTVPPTIYNCLGVSYVDRMHRHQQVRRYDMSKEEVVRPSCG